MRRWAGERPDFDQARTDRQVRQAVGEVPASVRLVLDLTAGGVKLTPGGRLPRALVRQVQEQRPHWYPLDRPASVEEDLLPLAVLHDLMRSVGLLRLAKGVLTPTRAAADDVEVVRRLRTWFVPGAFLGAVAELVVAELAARGPQHGDSLARQVHSLLGRGWFRGAEPVTDEDLLLAVAQMAAVMQGLDLIEVDEPVWRPGPSVLSLLPQGHPPGPRPRTPHGRGPGPAAHPLTAPPACAALRTDPGLTPSGVRHPVRRIRSATSRGRRLRRTRAPPPAPCPRGPCRRRPRRGAAGRAAGRAGLGDECLPRVGQALRQRGPPRCPGHRHRPGDPRRRPGREPAAAGRQRLGHGPLDAHRPQRQLLPPGRLHLDRVGLLPGPPRQGRGSGRCGQPRVHRSR